MNTEPKSVTIVPDKGVSQRHPVKVTALVYLKEALQNQRYEDCADFIQIAREFGAKPAEIAHLLEDPECAIL